MRGHLCLGFTAKQRLEYNYCCFVIDVEWGTFFNYKADNLEEGMGVGDANTQLPPVGEVRASSNHLKERI